MTTRDLVVPGQLPERNALSIVVFGAHQTQAHDGILRNAFDLSRALGACALDRGVDDGAEALQTVRVCGQEVLGRQQDE
ncbi:hypothetical protein ASD97_11420 [Streptomyces sp. Root63]|nr:hypothetical protein ASD29_16600 [Streptomyces sp. Root1295]KRA40404.1 hypothetical protein ASD97_11420 [Streptomyces sp. Root63]